MKKIIFAFAVLAFSGFLVSQSAWSQKVASVALPNDAVNVRKVKAGDADAQAIIGKYYFLGECGVKENNAEAIKWFQRSASKGSPYGYYYIGLCYSNGFGVAQNYDRGEAYFAKAFPILLGRAKNGDAEAQFHIGLCYQGGTGAEENATKALEWFEKAAEQGHPDALYEAAELTKDKEKAFRWIREAAKKDHAGALFRLGIYYRSGYGVEKSDSVGVSLILKAAQKGNGDAQNHIAECYEMGVGVQKNLSTAFMWYQKAASKDVYDALLSLGCMYRDGYGVNRNYYTAEKYLKKAASLDEYEWEDATMALNYMKAKGKAYYDKQPIRCPDDIYEIKSNDPFSHIIIDGWDASNEDNLREARLRYKRERVRAWGPDMAMKAASHRIEIGFSLEQVKFAKEKEQYKTKTIQTSHGTIVVLIYSDTNYFFSKNMLFGILQEDGVTVGNMNWMRNSEGNIVFIKDL